MGKKLGTLLVSNPSTYVERIYFNTALTKAEVDALFLNNPAFTDNEVYEPFSAGDNQNYIQIIIYKEKGYITINALVNGSIVGIYGSDGWRDAFNGVTSKYLEFNSYGVSEVNGTQMGTKNDLLQTLLSMNSDFKDTETDIETLLHYIGSAIKTKKGSTAKINAQNYESEILALSTGGSSEVTGTPIPVGEYVENVYLNTSLSVDEVVSIIKSANLDSEYDEDNCYIIGVFENVGSITIIKIDDDNYCVFGFINDIPNFYFSTVSDESSGITFTGWNPDFSNPIVVNATNNTTCTQNDKLSSLISITPFESGSGGITPTGTKEITTNGTHDVTNYASVNVNVASGGIGGTAVPNNAYVDKIYINENVSGKKWYEVFEKLTFLENALLTVPYVPLLFSANGTPIITIEKHNAEYHIVAITDMNNQRYTTMAIINRKPIYIYENDVQTDEIGCWHESLYIYNNEWLINGNVISEYSGIPIGTQNELLKDLISITPFE